MAYKEVYFHEYCKKCKYKNLGENEFIKTGNGFNIDICNECLSQPANIDSHRPVNFKEE